MSDWRADIKMTRAEELAQELFKANKRIAELEQQLEASREAHRLSADDYARCFQQQRQRDELVKAAGLVVNMWFQAPDAGSLPVALDELREALVKVEEADG